MPNPVINRRLLSMGGVQVAPLDPAVTDWVNRVQINGGAKPSAATISAVATWWNTLKTSSIDTQLLTLNFFAPDSQAAHRTPFVVGGGNDPWTGINNFSVNGFSSGGAGESCITGLNPASVFSTSDMGLSCYVRTATVKPRIAWGGGNGGTFAQMWNSGSSYFVASYNAWTIPGVPSTVAVDTYGFFSANRTATNSTTLYNANGSVAWASIGTNAGASGAPPSGAGNNSIAWNSAGIVTITDVCLLSFLAAHHGLTSPQGQTLFSATQTLRQAFGGGFT